MSYGTSERSWLLNPALLKLVNQCRRLIQSEFGVKLHLTDDDIEQRLAEYVSESQSSELNEIWETLAPQIPNLEFSASETEPEPEPESDPEQTPVRQTKRIYRGQVVD